MSQHDNSEDRILVPLCLYTLLRFTLLIVFSVFIIVVGHIIDVAVPIVVALLFALLIATPLSLVIGARMRIKIVESLYVKNITHQQERANLRRQLHKSYQESA